ncbi:MAG: hypothetical protein ACRDQ2_19895, partial [Gaiellales bacterium]
MTLFAAAALFVLGLTLAACGGDDDEATTEQGGGGVTEYVGAVAGVDVSAAPDHPHLVAKPGDYYVAVAIDDAGKVKAYICDGTGNSQSFEGTVNGDRLELESDSGEATLTATVSDSTVEGEIALEDEALDFTANQAKESGGLYTFRIQRDGRRFRAESERGNVLKGKTAKGGTQLISTFTPAAGGEPERLVNAALPSGADTDPLKGELFDEYRVIRLDNGHSRGNPTISSQQLQTQTQLGATTLQQRNSN